MANQNFGWLFFFGFVIGHTEAGGNAFSGARIALDRFNRGQFFFGDLSEFQVVRVVVCIGTLAEVHTTAGWCLAFRDTSYFRSRYAATSLTARGLWDLRQVICDRVATHIVWIAIGSCADLFAQAIIGYQELTSPSATIAGRAVG